MPQSTSSPSLRDTGVASASLFVSLVTGPALYRLCHPLNPTVTARQSTNQALQERLGERLGEHDLMLSGQHLPRCPYGQCGQLKDAHSQSLVYPIQMLFI